MIERYGLIWIWTGEAEADPSLLPSLSFVEETPPNAVNHGYMATAANYLLMTDNIMDLSHADFVHPSTLGTSGAVTGSVPQVRSQDGTVEIFWSWRNFPAMPVFAPLLPNNGERSDGWIKVKWSAPTHMVLSSGVSDAEASPEDELQSTTLHTMTPADDGNTHYFFVSTRSFLQDNVQVTEMAKAAQHQAFVEEDKPMLEDAQKLMGTSEFWSLKPWILSADGAAVRVRRTIEKYVREEEKGRARRTAEE